MLQVPVATGLNSGDTRRYVRKEYWEGTQHPRAEIWEDAFQQFLLPRYEAAVGRPLDFDIEEPSLDDAPAIIEKVGALKGLIAIGFDAKEAVAYVGLDGVKWNGLPLSADPTAMPAAATTPQDASGMTVNAGDTTRRDSVNTTQTVAKAVHETRDDITGREFPGLHTAVRQFLIEQRDRVIAKIEETFPPTKAERTKSIPTDWWDAALEEELLRSRLRTIYLTLGRGALGVVANNTSRILPGKSVTRILDDVLARSGLRITDINETTRKTIADTLAEGVRRGYSIPQLTGGVADEAYGGVRGALTANGINIWDDYRAELIARTETMQSYNEAALLGYQGVDVGMVTAIDGDMDKECARRDGSTYPIDEALGIADHPNGTLDWVPLT